jgi:hypothetical protein
MRAADRVPRCTAAIPSSGTETSLGVRFPNRLTTQWVDPKTWGIRDDRKPEREEP